MNWSAHSATSVGFTLLYSALMAALIVGTTPHLDGWRTLIVGVVLLPCGLIGLSLLIYRTLIAPKQSPWVIPERFT
jgi:hypothetical protein